MDAKDKGQKGHKGLSSGNKGLYPGSTEVLGIVEQSSTQVKQGSTFNYLRTERKIKNLKRTIERG